ncbi:type II secretion system minor pseudopilin GspI [Arenicella sp. 4NH20-0111]|uniref:type II secretion system minor pseudopilin GspI n=1 Tax=Arenicella sp. 4NH20-0111 TaxID=3127648 RepID=UPI003340A3A5
MGKHSRQSGFTLIEVMVALVFVALGISTVIQVTTSYVGNITELEKRALASWVASNHIAEIRFESETERVRTGNKSKRYKMGGYQWRSKAKIAKTEVERVFLLEVEVWNDRGNDKTPYASYTTAVTENF